MALRSVRCTLAAAISLTLFAALLPNPIVNGSPGLVCEPTWANLNYVDPNHVDPAEVGTGHLLDIYLPAEGEGPFPVVIYIHGSAWTSSDSKSAGKGVAALLGPEGIATVAINHRGTKIPNPDQSGPALDSGIIFPAQIHDAKAAVRYVRATATEHSLDPDRIAVFGGSSGGHLAALLGTSGGIGDYKVGDVTMNLEGSLGPYTGTSSEVLAVCEGAGPIDFLTLNTCPQMPSDTNHDAQDSPASTLIGGPIQGHPDECALANPMTYIGPEDPPFAIFHGEEDRQVPPCQSQELYDALQAEHVPSTLFFAEGVGHNNLASSQEVVERVIAFLKGVLRPAILWDAVRTDILPAATQAAPADFTAMGSLVFFTAYDGAHGRELWVSDGSLENAHLVRDIRQAVVKAGPTELTAVGERLFFVASDQRGKELWVSDGTADGTKRVKDIRPGPLGSSPSGLVARGGILFFCADDGQHGQELWRSNGTAPGTYMVADLRSTGGSQPTNLCALRSKVFFSADGDGCGRELWESDGTPTGTKRVADIRVGGSGSSPQELTAVGPSLYFSADDGTTGRELWIHDGSGTRRVRDIRPGQGGSKPQDLTAIGSKVLFQASHPTYGTELWASDGTEDGTYLVKDIAPSGGAKPRQLTALGNRVFFIADGSSDTVWTSDGSSDGTYALAETGIEYPTNTCDGWGFATVAGALLFLSWDGGPEFSVWRTDGTCWGTYKVASIPRTAGPGMPFWFTAAGNAAFFTANQSTSSADLWRVTRLPEESPSDRVAAFYYPWYENPETDGAWRHWNEPNFGPPQDISSDYFPFLGAYSAADPAVVARHFAWLREAGVGVIVTSWWGRESREDLAVPLLLDTAARCGMRVAFHIEPYPGRSADNLVNDIQYLYDTYGGHPAFFRTTETSRWNPDARRKGLFFLWDPGHMDSGGTSAVDATYWRTAVDAIHATRGGIVVAATEQADWVDLGHFDGLYNYVTIATGSDIDFSWGQHLPDGAWYIPCVTPGLSARRIGYDEATYVPRRDGVTYDGQWLAALESGRKPNMVGITSFNEWHEGTQIEPAARDRDNGDAYEYVDYDPLSPEAYLERTREWVDLFLSGTVPEWNRARIRLATSSDWTTLRVVEGATSTMVELVSVSPQATTAEATADGLRLAQSSDTAGREPGVEMIVDMYLLDLTPGQDVVFEIDWGLPSCMTVSASGLSADGNPGEVDTMRMCSNETAHPGPVRFTVPASVFMGEAP